MKDDEIRRKLLKIIENNPTDWPLMMVPVVMNDPTQRTAALLDEICQFNTVEDAKAALLNPKH